MPDVNIKKPIRFDLVLYDNKMKEMERTKITIPADVWFYRSFDDVEDLSKRLVNIINKNTNSKLNWKDVHGFDGDFMNLLVDFNNYAILFAMDEMSEPDYDEVYDYLRFKYEER